MFLGTETREWVLRGVFQGREKAFSPGSATARKKNDHGSTVFTPHTLQGEQSVIPHQGTILWQAVTQQQGGRRTFCTLFVIPTQG